jgi:molybdopterin-guanine dinucleotide biosynthesis protein A
VGSIEREHITGVILAGGRAERMGGEDKGLLHLAGRPLIEYALDILRAQVATILISANRNEAPYARYGYPLVRDERADFQGPLAGIASAMRAAETRYLLTWPCDAPFAPCDLAVRLARALATQPADIAMARSEGRPQPVFALLDCELLPSLRNYLDQGERKTYRWYGRHRLAIVDCGEQEHAFLNVNTPEDRALAERLLARERAVSTR